MDYVGGWGNRYLWFYPWPYLSSANTSLHCRLPDEFIDFGLKGARAWQWIFRLCKRWDASWSQAPGNFAGINPFHRESIYFYEKVCSEGIKRYVTMKRDGLRSDECMRLSPEKPDRGIRCMLISVGSRCWSSSGNHQFSSKPKTIDR